MGNAQDYQTREHAERDIAYLTSRVGRRQSATIIFESMRQYEGPSRDYLMHLFLNGDKSQYSIGDWIDPTDDTSDPANETA
ncbi:MAG: hypothetical protein Q7O66_19890 [Dehalococcoidia bacterium]|nr:hypothetical protein [Dehalococcoidia bacterium]